MKKLPKRLDIYRVENKNGQGPYTSLGTSSWGDTDHVDIFHPSPREEGLTMEHGHHKCCFFSKKQMHNWFSDQELVRLADHDYCIVEIEVETKYLQIGSQQAIFIPDEGINDYLDYRETLEV
jgi:hypothetical protein